VISAHPEGVLLLCAVRFNCPDGQRPLVYKFHHSTAGQLRDDQTLAGAGVKDGDTLRLYHEMIAGGKR